MSFHESYLHTANNITHHELKEYNLLGHQKRVDKEEDQNAVTTSRSDQFICHARCSGTYINVQLDDTIRQHV